MTIEKQRPPSGWVIQSLILSKTKFKTKKEATAWITSHNFKTSHKGKGADETSTSWRFRQRDPSDFTQFRTIALTDGVSAVYGKLKVVKKQNFWPIIFDLLGGTR
ncbi:MAG: hypothetical protein ACXABY_33385 [Candidatus Thorarchaeota archaeon]|jgi:hypothetical protein